MKKHLEIPKDALQTKVNKTSTSKKQYCKPQLVVLGDLRSLTLSGSPGVLDSDMSSGIPGEI